MIQRNFKTLSIVKRISYSENIDTEVNYALLPKKLFTLKSGN